MKKLCLLIALLSCRAWSQTIQVQPPKLVLTSNPIGDCTDGRQAVNLTNTTSWLCVGGAWRQIALDGVFQATSTTTTPVFTGTGLNDFTLSGTYLCGDTRNYVIQIDATGTPDTWAFSQDGGATFPHTGQPVDTTDILLQCGLSIKWGATTGHTGLDQWSWTASSVAPLSITKADSTPSVSIGQTSVTILNSDGSVWVRIQGGGDPVGDDFPANPAFTVGAVIPTVSPFNGIHSVGFMAEPGGQGFIVGDPSGLNPSLTELDSGGLALAGTTSGAAVLSAAAVAGFPNTIDLPTTTGASNSVLTTDGGNPQQTSWTANCSDGNSPAVCGANSVGAVAVPTGVNPTLTVNTTKVTANSRIFLQNDESVTISGVTCNTTLSTLVQPVVTARTAGTSFTVQIGATIAVNPACVSYWIVN